MVINGRKQYGHRRKKVSKKEEKVERVKKNGGKKIFFLKRPWRMECILVLGKPFLEAK